MADEFKLPDIGEGLAEGEIVKWLVAEGDDVAEDQPLVEVMTDKATVEIPSPRAGTVKQLVAAEGDIIKIGATILVFGDGAGGGNGAGEPVAVEDAGEGGEGEKEAVSADQIAQARQVARAERQAAEQPSGERKPWEAPAVPGGAVAPAARRLAAELGVDVARVAGSGRGGLVTKEDVRGFADGAAQARRQAPAPEATQAAVRPAPQPKRAEPETAAPQAPAATPGMQPADGPSARPAAAKPAAAPGAEERIPLRGLRRTIAERMVIAKTTVPHYTYVEEVDMSEIVALRNQAKAKAAGRGIKLTFLPFIIRALVATLKDHPYLNASLDDEAGEIVLKRYYNVGIAAATERGLMVPVVHGADARDLFDLAAEIERLSEAARAGSIGLDDLQGGTFTITSTGNIGGLLATPVINVPEVAILGVTAIRERPVVRDGEIVIRQVGNLSLSCDHRVVDGAVAALFMRDLVALLEDPKLQLLAGL